jgi:hypothetical protein
MKITKEQLKRIIKEEKDKLLSETPTPYEREDALRLQAKDLAPMGIPEDPMEPLGLALERALEEAQKLRGSAKPGSNLATTADEIQTGLDGLLEILHGI